MTTNNAPAANNLGLPNFNQTAATPHDKLMTAISICQMQILASDSNYSGPSIWGLTYFPTSALEHAVQILIDILPDVETLPAYEVKQ